MRELGFSALHLPPIFFPHVKWLTLPPALLGIVQAFAHGVLMPRAAGQRYSPGMITSVLLHVPIGVASIRALQAEGPITRQDWAKTAGVLALFAAFGVVAPNAAFVDRNSPYPVSDVQLGRFGAGTRDEITELEEARR